VPPHLADPFVVLRLVCETDERIVVGGAQAPTTLGPASVSLLKLALGARGGFSC
jgi:aromatic ring hydroxylase